MKGEDEQRRSTAAHARAPARALRLLLSIALSSRPAEMILHGLRESASELTRHLAFRVVRRCRDTLELVVGCIRARARSRELASVAGCRNERDRTCRGSCRRM